MIGTRLRERYELVAEIGKGGMGVVYRAHDPLLGRDVAVKMIPPHALSPEAEERFLDEARLVASMDHPAIVPIHDVGRHDGAVFFVMPLVEGDTLRRLLEGGGPEPVLALEIVAQAAEALDYSHARGVVHRDVKPENLMVQQSGSGVRVRVMDFGVAWELDRPRPNGDGLPGTVSYLSPEQVLSGQLDGRSDLYALGTVLYECLAGEPPFTGQTAAVLYAIVQQPPPSLSERGVEVDPELEAVVMRCLMKAPAERLASGQEMARALRHHVVRLRGGPRGTGVADDEPPAGSSAAIVPPPPLIGRRTEWRELQSRLAAARFGDGQLVFVGGEAGVGKTRLLEALEELGREQGFRVLRGWIADREGALPYQGFCELLQDAFGKGGPAGAPRLDLADLAPELVAHFPLLAEVEELRRQVPAGSAGLAPRGAVEPVDLFELLSRTFIRLAAERPLLLALENLHAGDDSIHALEYIVRRLSRTPTLIAASYHTSEVDRRHPLARLQQSLAADPQVVKLTLKPFTPAELRLFVEWLLGSRDLRPGLVAKVQAATGGHPFFSRELVRSLVESGDLRRAPDGAWEIAGGEVSGSWPATVQQMVAERFERLSEDERHVLSVAAVLGKSFDDRDLEALVDPDCDLDQALDALVHRDVLREERDRLSFTSGVVRDVVYRLQPRRRRRTLHQRTGEHLEKRYARRIERVAPQLVEHFFRAGDAGRTVCYALELAKSSIRSSSPDEAVHAVDKALQLLDEADLDRRGAVEGRLRLALAEAYELADRGDEALAEAERAAELFATDGDHEAAARAALYAAETAWRERRGDVARGWIERGLAAGRDVERDPDPGGGAAEVRERLLTLGATLANLRGERAVAEAFLAEAAALEAPAESGVPAVEVPAGGTLRVAFLDNVDHLDPAEFKTEEEAEIDLCLYQTLFTSDAEGNLLPSLCRAFKSSEDDRVFTLVLDPAARFADGTPLGAADVKASLERACRHGGVNLETLLSSVCGYEEFRAGEAPGLSGITVAADEDAEAVVVRLREPLPIFPTLLTHVAVAIVREEGDGRLIGSGPFRLAEREPGRIVVERNVHAWKAEPRLDRIEFVTSLGPPEMARALAAGEVDLVRDVLPEDLEELLRDPRLRAGYAEATKRNVYFVLLRSGSPRLRHLEVRRALTWVVSTHDLVWRTLGRFAQPATGLLPPGLLGHDAGRRRRVLEPEEARELLRTAVPGGELELTAAVQPVFLGRYGALTSALFDAWRSLGIRVSVETSSMREFIARGLAEEPDVDLLIVRWNASYDDPDNFASLFHGHHGMFRPYYASPEADRLIDAARHEARSEVRRALYLELEQLLAERAVLLPLFHDVEVRLAGPRVAGFALSSTRPHVDYTALGKLAASPRVPAAAASPAISHRPRGGEVHVPTSSGVLTLDPLKNQVIERIEVVSNVFETLTGIADGAQVVPKLAAAWSVDGGGRVYRFRLRPELRFHDGRRLSARDVRYSFERVLLHPSGFRGRHLLFSIRGAQAFAHGETSELLGLRVVSGHEVEVELEEPLSFFPALVAHPSLGVVPEGTEDFTGAWRGGCVGTGPFRVVHCDGGRIELERNPYYWRPGSPKCDGLVFHTGLEPERIAEDFRAGLLSLAWNLRGSDVEALRHDPDWRRGYHEAPRLGIFFLAMNVRRGPFADLGRRRALAFRLSSGELGLEARMAPAFGIFPPGFLGYEPGGPRAARATAGGGTDGAECLRGVTARVRVHPEVLNQYDGFWERMLETLDDLGMEVDAAPFLFPEVGQPFGEDVDLVLVRWSADYPDADTFATALLNSNEGLLAPLGGSPALDRLIHRGRAEKDPGLRHAAYCEIGETLAREERLVPLFYERTYRFCQPTLEGFRFRLMNPEVCYDELYLAP